MIFVAGSQLGFGFPKVLGQTLTIVDSLFLLLIVYILGHVLATPAKAVFEELFVGRVLGRPSENLFKAKRPLIRGLLFPGYYKALPAATANGIKGRAKEEVIHQTGEALFLHVRYSHDIRGDEKVLARLDSFRNQYGFCRKPLVHTDGG